MGAKKVNSKRRDVSALTNFEFNKENPFLKQALEVINQNVAKKYKTATKTSEKAILQAFDPNTGDMLGHTQFIRQIEVDEEQFAKLYLSRFSAFFDLKPQAIKVFGYILNQLIPNKDEFVFILEDCLEYTEYKSENSVRIGLTNLLENQMIARGKTEFLYFINPMVVFNGNRITFAESYVKRKKKPEVENPDQLKLDF
ncbi:replication/maintenance protein RepL, partial [Kaistella sp.]|uniref:replication/maintenance protein RepL n=1 Tax=Kaistella sp. TaxID=2782235 RepID=UPI0035A1A20D